MAKEKDVLLIITGRKENKLPMVKLVKYINMFTLIKMLCTR